MRGMAYKLGRCYKYSYCYFSRASGLCLGIRRTKVLLMISWAHAEAAKALPETKADCFLLATSLTHKNKQCL